MDRIKSMQIFVRVVEAGSLSAVAREAAITQPTVSKVIAALEKELGVRLLERSTTGLTPTDQGKRFYQRAKLVLEEYSEAVAEARDRTNRPAGFLRINAPVALGQFRLNALVLEFLALYPDIQVELILDDRFIDLVEQGVDVALRLNGPHPPNVIARKIAVSPRYLVASPDYLRRNIEIKEPKELEKHEYIRFAWLSAGDTIELRGPDGSINIVTNGRYRVNNALAIRESLAIGAGLGLAPEWLVQDLIELGQLVRILPNWIGSPQEAFLLYPSRRYQSQRTKVFMQFMAERISKLPGFGSPRDVIAGF